MSAKEKPRGVVLIIVLAVLVVLALIATTFATLQSTERATSRNYLDLTKARLAAEAGVDYAVSELRRQVEMEFLSPSPIQPWRYFGQDDNENGTGAVNVPLEEATNPSFAVEDEASQNPYDANVVPRHVQIDGVDRGLSGAMPGTYGRYGELYVLKVSDASGKIHVNEGVGQYRFIAAPWGKTEATGSMNLRRILNHLGNAVNPPVPTLGDRVVSNRPVAGYQSVLELKSFLSSGEYDRIADFVTAQAWQDSDVINPVPYTQAQASTLQNQFGIRTWRGNTPLYRFGRGKDFMGALVSAPLQVYPSTMNPAFNANSLTHAVYAMDELNPMWIETTSRAPVNINSASREVLIALLADLRGVFMSERRRNNFVSRIEGVGGYGYIQVKHTYSPDPTPLPSSTVTYQEGDELGFLYETYPITGGTSGGILASTLADAIIACRSRKAWRGFDFSTALFGGPFRTWRQFNAFCDLLVPKDLSAPKSYEILVDPRNIFYDHAPDAGANAALGTTGTAAVWVTGGTPLVASDFERLVACRAIADVLKANFNPNCTLNELNPDKNLHLLVDKTDLVVHSTEFAFMPTGCYDVESLGRVLQPKDTATPDVFAGDNLLLAEVKVHAGVKLYDLVRQTSQSQFAAGTCSPRSASLVTNNNLTLEVGPEPDNGRAPLENRWGGYIAFPTLGGFGLTKTTGGAPVATPVGVAELGSTMHTHLSRDFDAHAHADGIPQDLGSNQVNAEYVHNFPDPGETLGGPYDPVDGVDPVSGQPGNRYRLARSFRLSPPIGGGTWTPPVNIVSIAPEDLRIDGGYLERNGGLAYWISRTSYAQNTALKQGVLSYWVKPNFDPARSGKPRLYADMCRRCALSPASGGYIFTAAQFVNIWNAGHDTTPGTGYGLEIDTSWGEKNNDGTWPTFFTTPFRPQSLIFGVGYGERTGFRPSPGAWANYYQFMETSSLNHDGHKACPVMSGAGARSVFSGHEWVHVTLAWKKTTDATVSALQSATNTPYVNIMQPPCTSRPVHEYNILVNGKVPPTPLEVLWRYRPASENDSTIDWTVHSNGDQNSLRFGSPSRISRDIVDSRNSPSHCGNFSSDSTLDEIYFWNVSSNLNETNAIDLWHLGRYSCPKAADEGVFTSAAIPLQQSGERATASPAGGTTTAPVQPDVQVLGISWTWYGETNTFDPVSGQPVVSDRSDTGTALFPKVEASVAGGAWLSDDGFSLAVDAGGNAVFLPAGSTVQYKLRFTLPGADPNNTILLSTPVVDDVTLFVASGDTLFTYYYVNNTVN